MYTIKILDRAERELLKIPLKDRKRIAHKIDALAFEPRPAGALKLKASFPITIVSGSDFIG